MTARIYVVYKITFPNGKIYVGQTGDLERRKEFHLKARTLVGNALRSCDCSAVKWEILGRCLRRSTAKRMETRCILRLKANDPRYGYNLTCGGFHDVPHRKRRRRFGYGSFLDD